METPWPLAETSDTDDRGGAALTDGRTLPWREPQSVDAALSGGETRNRMWCFDTRAGQRSLAWPPSWHSRVVTSPDAGTASTYIPISRCLVFRRHGEKIFIHIWFTWVVNSVRTILSDTKGKEKPLWIYENMRATLETSVTTCFHVWYLVNWHVCAV